MLKLFRLAILFRKEGVKYVCETQFCAVYLIFTALTEIAVFTVLSETTCSASMWLSWVSDFFLTGCSKYFFLLSTTGKLC